MDVDFSIYRRKSRSSLVLVADYNFMPITGSDPSAKLALEFRPATKNEMPTGLKPEALLGYMTQLPVLTDHWVWHTNWTRIFQGELEVLGKIHGSEMLCDLDLTFKHPHDSVYDARTCTYGPDSISGLIEWLDSTTDVRKSVYRVDITSRYHCTELETRVLCSPLKTKRPWSF